MNHIPSRLIKKTPRTVSELRHCDAYWVLARDTCVVDGALLIRSGAPLHTSTKTEEDFYVQVMLNATSHIIAGVGRLPNDYYTDLPRAPWVYHRAAMVIDDYSVSADETNRIQPEEYLL